MSTTGCSCEFLPKFSFGTPLRDLGVPVILMQKGFPMLFVAIHD